MKKFVFLVSLVGLFALSAFAQTPNFAGTWKLDTSKLNEQMAARIESQTITVEQTATEVKATTATVRKQPPAGGGGGGGQGGGQGRGGFGGGGDGTATYKLDGSEVLTERETPNGKIPTKTTAKIDGGKLNISASTTFNGPNGEMTTTSKTTWELSADGKTLTVKSTRMTQNGEMTTETVYNKS
ncbi:MAG TPA: hypothetical protein PKY82_04920 [Pyrinomonadaceae bacterium]|nr:hypothetical protein [Pyrinomonadaceae bacterium]